MILLNVGWLRCPRRENRGLQKEKVYVQHRILENKQRIYDLLQAGAFFYVCGFDEQPA